MNRRTFNRASLSIVPLGLTATVGSTHAASAATAPNQISRATGGVRGWPFASPVATDLPDNYVMEEFVLRGTAKRYHSANGTTPQDNGMWQTEAVDPQDFATRVYVVRPVNTADFNGIAVVNWQNVTAGFDIGAPIGPEFFRGYAWIGLTTQKIGIDGTPNSTPGLRQWDPQRYGDLAHPGDAWSYDIFSQLGNALKSNNSIRDALLAQLRPSTVIATGGSQSAMRLASYINAAHAHDRVYDGFYLTVHWGICPPLEELPLMAMFAPTDKALSPSHGRIRDDLGTPIMVVATECESLFNYPTRQPDSDTFRFWEIAGGAHQSPTRADTLAAIMKRDEVYAGPGEADRNNVEWGYIDSAAVRALANWAATGSIPASVPRIEITRDAQASSAVIARDEHGNAKGGVRMPELEAPIASYHGARGDINNPAWLQGQTFPFSDATIKSLYPDKSHTAASHAAIDALAKIGLVNPEDIAAAKSRFV